MTKNINSTRGKYVNFRCKYCVLYFNFFFKIKTFFRIFLDLTMDKSVLDALEGANYRKFRSNWDAIIEKVCVTGIGGLTKYLHHR